MTVWLAEVKVRNLKASEIVNNSTVVAEVAQFKQAAQEYPKEGIVNVAVAGRAPCVTEPSMYIREKILCMSIPSEPQ